MPQIVEMTPTARNGTVIQVVLRKASANSCPLWLEKIFHKTGINMANNIKKAGYLIGMEMYLLWKKKLSAPASMGKRMTVK
ncbi:MAG: hypothetical protein NPINA01_33270 [Nitrospinaceae bacterium]|nr:MAG: hypothetical protein NPINA01_33270 [Nitrospinaceae bacterium]